MTSVGPLVSGLQAPGHAASQPSSPSPSSPSPAAGARPLPVGRISWGWPEHQHISYAKDAITLLLLLLALPWLLLKLFKSPHTVLEGAGRHHLD